MKRRRRSKVGNRPTVLGFAFGPFEKKGRQEMRSRLLVLGLVLVLSTLTLSACGLAEATTVLTTDVTPEGPVDTELAAARDAALAYLGERYGEQAPPSGLAWSTGPIELAAPQEMGGSRGYQYTADRWVAMVTYPLAGPQRVTYRVRVANEAAGFRWEGQVDATGHVTGVSDTVPVNAPNPARARDLALAYVVSERGTGAPPEQTWTEESTSAGLIGGATLKYTAGEWVITVFYPIVPPERIIYKVTVTNEATGFLWEGQVGAAGDVRTTQGETTDWKTYTNEKHGYSLRYPSDCTFGPMPAGCKKSPPAERPAECLCFLNAEDPDRVFLQAFTGEKDDLKGAAFSVERTVHDLPPGADLIEWIGEEYPHYGKIPDEPNAKVGGIPAVRFYTPRSPMAPNYEEIYFIRDGGFFRIHMLDVDEETNRELYDRISAALDITVETSAVELPVVAWYGSVVSLPAGSQYDDYLLLLPERAGEIGVEGASEAIEAQIVALRDKVEPGKCAHFWGTLDCPALDYGGCELVVTRLRVDGPGPFFDPDPVEGWEGTVYSGPPGPRSGGDDYLVLAGDFPMQYGIDSLEPTLAAQLESLRDTRTVIRVWGELTAGIPDWNGTRIQVSRIEVVGEPPSPLVVADETVDGWIGALGKYPWGSQFEGFFGRNDGERFGIDAKDADAAVRQQIEAYRWTGARVQVWGRLLNNVPDVNGRQILVERIEAVSGPEEDSRNLALFASASASSVYPSDRWGTYHAWSAIDGRVESPWVEGAAGSGIGEWITLTFPGTVEVWGIGLDVGYDRDVDIFYANNRIKRATFVFSNGERVTLDSSDTRGVQMVHLARAPSPNIETTYVKMVIEEVYPGSRYDDTCLGEIEVWGRTG
jgi:hypothetical protein